jgi:hypothetical protein
MKRTLILLFIFLISFCAKAQKERELFRGGMFYHTGYVKNQLDFPKVEGFVTGIGGKIAFRVGSHLRLGTEGYVSTHSYNGNEGNYKMGWGGFLSEYQVFDERFTPVVGFTIGGATVHDLYMTGGDFSDNQPDEGIYKVYSSVIVAPHLSIEYSITESINLVCKADYALFPGIAFPGYIARGPRFYFGILFMR